MALSARLHIQQSQQLVMTPQLQQAIRLLQLSNIELTAFVETELERNPLLEREETDGDGEGDPPPSNSAEASGDGETGDDGWLDFENVDGSAVDALDSDPSDVYPDASPSDMAAHEATFWTDSETSRVKGEAVNYEAFVSEELTLHEHLRRQMHQVLETPGQIMIGQFLVDLVDEAGYLRGDLRELAEKLGADEAYVRDVLEKLQSCEPAGVFARSLPECLALQLRERDRLDPIMARFLEHLDRLAAHDLIGLRRAVGVDAEDLRDMIAEIRALDPKPGLRFGRTPLQPIVPDVIVRARSDGSWRVELNAETLPRVLVNRSYYATVAKAACRSDDKVYLGECLQTANWLVKSLDQRARTILKVSEEIVRQQEKFLTHGVQHLRPLNLRAVADAILMHESTISRVTSNKYMLTPRGIFELKYFFTSAIAAADHGDAHSSEAVRHRIRALIDAETAKTVLSDDKIVERLRCDGIDIARRTVAKYRESMRIPSSVQRRREKRLDVQINAAQAK